MHEKKLDKDIHTITVCENCNCEYEVVHDEEDPPEYCPFCGWHNEISSNDEEWKEKIWDE